MIELNKIYNEDCLQTMARMDDGSIDCCITSPPYWGLRDYGVDGQVGLESTPEKYVYHLVAVFSEVNRVLKKEGTLWLNLGDSYVAQKTGSFGKETWRRPSRDENIKTTNNDFGDLKEKNLVGIPWRVAFALQGQGWYLRSDIIWHKPNPMPESVTDRPTKAHEYIFLMSKNAKYYYDADAIREDISSESYKRLAQDVGSQDGSDRVPFKTNGPMKAVGGLTGANKRTVWTVTTQPYSEAHFATFPEKLIEPCVLAGCPKDGIVYDPFMGAGTTAKVALRADRNFIGSELNQEYCEIANKRIDKLLNQTKLFT